MNTLRDARSLCYSLMAGRCCHYGSIHDLLWQLVGRVLVFRAGNESSSLNTPVSVDADMRMRHVLE